MHRHEGRTESLVVDMSSYENSLVLNYVYDINVSSQIAISFPLAHFVIFGLYRK